MRIGVFDSGIGGLTVLHEALRLLPGADYLYFADTASVPYGNKPREQVRACVFAGVDVLVARGLDALVVACNTATSVAVEDLRQRHPFPIIGMEPAVKPALRHLEEEGGPGDRVLVLATDMTLREEKFRRLVARVDDEKRVDYLSAQGLVAFAEAGVFDAGRIDPYLDGLTRELDLGVYGAVVLGCTHFPFFRPHLARVFRTGAALVDGHAGTVNNLAARLGLTADPGGGPGRGTVTFLQSGPPVDPARFQAYLDRCSALAGA